ncbi:LysR family transcriptional regulator [Acidaminobacter hydrogenoformans]|uniref:DNA-binding transcriptional regulator, LysR family n=1 Tax=Acidaminobacter hydrogenoformans DSM 2784 TaxID=1120920 RepID=A0A1G5RYX6_9FIRM|nr:LysR family transcriptional regulator [Acidaminobacter hydrogenoformans]SCZ79312.1 DNA-binding transcriptional regulator, LysR family [Acidaminobacter hydrogenoformans DSM 2784]
MNLHQLYYFKTIAELEHYTKASEKLMVTQSSLSHSISELEKELNVKLFERNGRNVMLTKYGVFFLEYVKKSLNILEDGMAKLQDYANPGTGVVRLTYVSSLHDFIPYLITRYYEKTGNIMTKFQFYLGSTYEIEKQIENDDVDIGFSTLSINEKLAFHHIGDHETVLIVSKDHPLAVLDTVDLTDITDEKFITYNYQCQIRTYIDAIFDSLNIQPNIVSEAFHDNIIFGSVAAGFGIALVPEPLNSKYPNIKVIQIENDLPCRELHLLWHKSRYMSPAIENFKNFIIENGKIFDDYKRGIEESSQILL